MEVLAGTTARRCQAPAALQWQQSSFFPSPLLASVTIAFFFFLPQRPSDGAWHSACVYTCRCDCWLQPHRNNYQVRLWRRCSLKQILPPDVIINGPPFLIKRARKWGHGVKYVCQTDDSWTGRGSINKPTADRSWINHQGARVRRRGHSSEEWTPLMALVYCSLLD